mgnify:CR=1 FL=1
MQSLPLTQSLDPAVYPSPSRQLAPFKLTTDAGKPKNWEFSVQGAGMNAAAQWATFTGIETPFTPLPLASLAIPGLSYEPDGGPLPAAILTAQYRHGLPYLAEIDALSQLSKPKPSTPETLPPPPPPSAISSTPEPARPTASAACRSPAIGASSVDRVPCDCEFAEDPV